MRKIISNLIFCLFLFLATFCGVSNEYHEAIKIDGQWYVFYRVTIENDYECNIATAFGMGLLDKDGDLIEESIIVGFGPIMVPGQIETFELIIKMDDYEKNPRIECATDIEILCEESGI